VDRTYSKRFKEFRMEKIKLSSIFVIPVVDKDVSRRVIDAYIYLYCIEKGLQAPRLLLHLKKDFPLSYYL